MGVGVNGDVTKDDIQVDEGTYSDWMLDYLGQDCNFSLLFITVTIGLQGL